MGVFGSRNNIKYVEISPMEFSWNGSALDFVGGHGFIEALSAKMDEFICTPPDPKPVHLVVAVRYVWYVILMCSLFFFFIGHLYS